MDVNELLDDLVSYCDSHGVEIDPQEAYSKADTRSMSRGHVKDGKPRNKDASILLFLRNGTPNAMVWNHHSGEQFQWKATGFTNLDRHPKAAVQAEAAEFIEARQETAAKAAQAIYADALKNPVPLAETCPDGENRELHAYIIKKGLTSDGIVATTGTRLNAVWRAVTGDSKPIYNDSAVELLIPLTDADGQIWNLQRIREKPFPGTATNKMLLRGSKKTGLFYEIRPPIKTTAPIIIAEGWATAASIAQCVPESAGIGIYMAVDKGNLQPAALEIRKAIGIRHPIVFAADNDSTPGNPGMTAAQEAATAVDGKVIAPEEYGDWNDVMIRHGEGAVYKAFKETLQW